MPFNVAKFTETSFSPRTEKVRVEPLKKFFGKAKPLWEVRGATGTETARANEAQSKQQNMAAMVRALVSTDISEAEKTETIKEVMGISKDAVPGELAKRLELLQMCSVEPQIDLPVAVKLAETHPITFFALTNKILELTGKGQEVQEKH